MEKLSATTNALNWFEISISDLERARKFYESIFEVNLIEMEMGDMTMLMFPTQSPHSGGGLAKSPMHKPSHDGAIIYLNANPDLQLVLDRVEKAGGTIKMPKTKINDEIGAMAFITDTEGNTVGLHSGK